MRWELISSAGTEKIIRVHRKGDAAKYWAVLEIKIILEEEAEAHLKAATTS